jgi:hypothetical protein
MNILFFRKALIYNFIKSNTNFIAHEVKRKYGQVGLKSLLIYFKCTGIEYHFVRGGNDSRILPPCAKNLI